MTRKIYQLHIKETINEYATRNEAIDTMTALLKTDDSYTLEDFKIVEVETLNEYETLKEVANAICNDLSIFANEFEVGEICREFIEIEKKEKYPSWSSIELGRTIKVVDDFNKELPKGYSVCWNINHQCMIRLLMMRPQDLKAK